MMVPQSGGRPRRGAGGQPAVSRAERKAIQGRLRVCLEATFTGKTHEMIAAHLGIPRTTVTRWFGNPPTLPSSAHLLRLAALANISPTWVLSGRGPMLCTEAGASSSDVIMLLHELGSVFVRGKTGDDGFLDAFRIEQGDRVLRLFLMTYGELYRNWYERRLEQGWEHHRKTEDAVVDEICLAVDSKAETVNHRPMGTIPIRRELIERLSKLRRISKDEAGKGLTRASTDGRLPAIGTLGRRLEETGK
jgi:hypothetical protein